MEPLCLLRLVIILCIRSFAHSPSFFDSDIRELIVSRHQLHHRVNITSDFHLHSSIQSTQSLSLSLHDLTSRSHFVPNAVTLMLLRWLLCEWIEITVVLFIAFICCSVLVQQWCLCVNYLISAAFNLQHRRLLMNGKIKALHFLIVSFAVFIFSLLLLHPTFSTFLLLLLLLFFIWPLFTSSWKSTPCMHSSPSIHPAFHCQLILPIFQAFPFLHLCQYFDEEQDDHEYPYYYEVTTGVPP